jgi:hypothetical protein
MIQKKEKEMIQREKPYYPVTKWRSKLCRILMQETLNTFIIYKQTEEDRKRG